MTNDINATFSSTANFYFGTDGNTPIGQIDFVTVVLHELGHGLGILGFGEVDNDDAPTQGEIRASGFPSIWDRFIENGSEVSILDFADPSAALLAEFQSNDLFCNSEAATFYNGNVKPAIYAPGSWEAGSSYSHWDESTFPTGSTQALMTPFVANGEAIHDPGNAMLGFMQDMGWIICDNRLNTEQVVISDFYISPNPFVDRLDIQLSSNLRNDSFDATITDINGKVIFKETLQNENGQLSIEQLSMLKSSLYFLSLTSNTTGQTLVKKIIKR
ncbi:T9SS type A sorting domain-containing protein [Winogradskyella maritima]|uniref:T9SS type A sorting domain-containing protein n=1 Tax=Winogradskyella maritima TaxID=1517766 RepID=A0ABV8ADA8_9FLAO|nr:T9SS type A sorting domain-containing protein [Winogradskyella maritima]